ncbi:CPBP family intramembrane glutamic endopeptidase [Candidatus Chlorohelix sp.]|uniref:CPBP family intramembrane glutamic endopeptidase n=1 Tax=Candidatus Chlorohelix sp. TaxID=3139201 RepID=UPI0030705F81
MKARNIATPTPFGHYRLSWIYLALFAGAELLIATANPLPGLALHCLILSALILHSAFIANSDLANLYRSLMVIAILRILSMSLPLDLFLPIARYPLIYLPVLFSIWQVARLSGLRASELRLRTSNLFLQLLIASGGFGLGALEYLILQPSILSEPFAWVSFLTWTLVLLLCAGFCEQLLFSGLLLTFSTRTFGKYAILYVSLLYAALTISSGSLLRCLFAFGIGLSFAFLAKWGNSLLSVSLAQGTANLTVLLLMPYLEGNSTNWLATLTRWVIWVSLPASIGGVFVLWWHFRQGKVESSIQ